VLAGFAFTYLPWLLLSGDRSAVFLFYLLPAVPFMCLALAYAVVHLGWLRRAKPAVALAGAAVVASFLFYYPVLAKVPLERDEWLRRIWVFDDCDRPAAPARPEPSRDGLESADSPPEPEHVEPEGWCWI
jgi:dolichyl-phosphate-mannose--protein O-mannosyl transferase